MTERKLKVCAGRDVTPRHFIRLNLPEKVEWRYGELFAPCDVESPAYYERSHDGGLRPVSIDTHAALVELIGPPKPMERPAIPPVSGRFREAIEDRAVPEPKRRRSGKG